MSLRNRRHPAVGTATTRWLSYLQTGNPPANPFEGASDIGLMGETPPWYGDPSDPDPDQPDPELDAEPDEDFPPPDAEPLFPDLALPYPLYERTVQGWAHLGMLRCACGAEGHNPDARSYHALYESAWQAGWRRDAFGVDYCGRCAQLSAGFRSADQVTAWASTDLQMRERTLAHWQASHERGRHHAGVTR